MLIITDPKEAYHQVQAWKRQGLSVGLVPTMGFLHEGHMSLVAASQTRCERTVVSIFVNPTQFRPEEDLSSYPRDEERDRTMLEQAGVDLLFLPSVEAMYPRGFASSVEVRGLSEKLAGAHRPGHFHGVTTVCAKLFNCIPADLGFFGQKDYQQVQIIKRLVQDLNFPIGIVMCPIVREPDGLARSSRNVYLSPEERARAVVLSESVAQASQLYFKGERRTKAFSRLVRENMSETGFELMYAVVVDPETLEEVDVVVPGSVLLIEVYAGRTRLYDNHIF